ncbi:hypothetical protein DSO57_1000858 [Entomophthora muscae]|uniref:Uncharacterized protein n=1 Tax=Entomophthora muscae TaxID=34485 RepID=A0ACC2U7Y1_9FUNG|nr:hypothetical protein DSO57_1000858 [Entomophthora muscae]
MELASGYWKVDLSPEDKQKAALITSEGLFELLVCLRDYMMPLLPSNGLSGITSLTTVIQ